MVTNTFSDGVLLLLGLGNGTFTQQHTFIDTVEFAVGLRPFSLTTGDFNRDEILDLATANIDSDDVSVLLGVGNRTAGKPIT